MKRNKWCLLLLAVALSVWPMTVKNVVNADTKTAAEATDQAAMEKVLSLYSRIHRDLVTDTLGLVRDDASLLLVAARKLKDEKLSSELQKAAKRMITSASTGMGHPSIPQAREDFKGLSAPLVEWVRKNKPEGWVAVHCSMVDAAWVQRKDQEIQNPYTDEKMRSCGEKVS